MNDLCKTEFFCLLSEKSQGETNEQMKQAYGTFVKNIPSLYQSVNDYEELFRNLSLTRIELVFLELHFQYEQGGKCT